MNLILHCNAQLYTYNDIVSPSSTGFFEGLIGVLFKLWHLNMIRFLDAIICWQKQAEYSVHFTIKKFMVPHANWHPTSEHTKYRTYQQQCIGSKCNLWGMKMTTTTKLVEYSFLSPVCLLVSHYDLCPVDSCVNLLSALDSRNGVMSMRTSPHLRALLINNNPCGQKF